MSRCRGERDSTSCGHFLCLLFQGHSVEAQVFPFLKIQAWGQGDGSVVKSVIVLAEERTRVGFTAQTWQLKILSNTSSKGSHALFWLPQALHL